MDKWFTERIKGKYYIADDGCWIWTASKRLGYGLLKSPSHKEHRVTRLMYAHTYGPIHPNQLVLHKCMNKACINPDHLETGSHQDNAHYQDRSKLTEEAVQYIRASRGSKKVGELGAMFKVSPNHIYKIWNKRQWA